MKLRSLFAGFIVAVAAITVSAAEPSDAPRFVEISKPFVNINRDPLDPKSPIVKMAKRGERYPLIYEGTSWYQVRVDEGANIKGWVEHDAAIIVNTPTFKILGLPGVPFIVMLVFFALAAAGITVYVLRLSKQNDAEPIL